MTRGTIGNIERGGERSRKKLRMRIVKLEGKMKGVEGWCISGE